MFNINIRSRSEELNYIHLLTLKIFNINLRSRSAEQIYTPLLTLSIFILRLRLGSDVLKYYTVALSMFNINLRSRSAELNYTPLLTLSRLSIIHSQATFGNIWCTKLLHGCSQYVQYQPTFKICGIKLYTSAYPQ